MITNYKKYNPSLKIVEKLPGRILTQPSETSTHSFDDNADGNLICRVHDIIASDTHQYTVLDLLGTGTFGQVFRCQLMKTGELVAVKVVKGKPAYRTQGLLEVKIAKLLNTIGDPEDKQHIVRILDSFEYKGHICIVFELLGCSLLDLLTQNQYRGLPLSTVQRYAKQILMSLVVLQDASVIHCDLKPENILLINKRVEKKKSKLDKSSTAPAATAIEVPSSSSSLLSAQLRGSTSSAAPSQSKANGETSTSSNIGDIKLIDFGSACFEGKTMYSYIQSRFYRSPEVLLGIPYNGAIDIWSLGCVCAEMFVGLPIFPGVSQHNQLCRIVDMLGPIPDFLVRQGKNGPKFFIQETTVSSQFPYAGFGPNSVRNFQSAIPPAYDPYRQQQQQQSQPQRSGSNFYPTASPGPGAGPQTQPSYRLKTPEEFAFENKTTVPTFKKYLKYDHLDDIILRCPSAKKSKLTILQKNEEMTKRKYFLDFLKGLFNLNPFERWTARQALNHPFIRDYERIGLQQITSSYSSYRSLQR
jgi:dual specificity protein kinase YAK1